MAQPLTLFLSFCLSFCLSFFLRHRAPPLFCFTSSLLLFFSSLLISSHFFSLPASRCDRYHPAISLHCLVIPRKGFACQTHAQASFLLLLFSLSYFMALIFHLFASSSSFFLLAHRSSRLGYRSVYIVFYHINLQPASIYFTMVGSDRLARDQLAVSMHMHMHAYARGIRSAAGMTGGDTRTAAGDHDLPIRRRLFSGV